MIIIRGIKMHSLSLSKPTIDAAVFSSLSRRGLLPLRPPSFPKSPLRPHSTRRRRRSGASAFSELRSAAERLPEKRKPLYSHSLPCIEAWLGSLGFRQSREDRALWIAETPSWHAYLALDATDLSIRYFKSGPGNLEKDVERRFSYALSREDIENAILGGP